MKMSRFAAVPALCALLVAGCSESGPGEGPGATAGVAAGKGSGWLVSVEPAGAVAVGDAKASVEEGQEVVIRGRIGGRKDPMSAGSPVFLIVDLDVPHCGQIPGDTCPTPWDYCCEPRESLTANSATVQLVGEDGKPLSVDPKAAGLSPLDEVVVVGKVGPRPTPGVLTIFATAVYRNGE